MGEMVNLLAVPSPIPAKLNEVMNLIANGIEISCWLPTQKASLENQVVKSLLSQVRTASQVNEVKNIPAAKPKWQAWLLEKMNVLSAANPKGKPVQLKKERLLC